MNDSRTTHVDLQAMAQQIMLEHGFEPEFPAAAQQQLAAIQARPPVPAPSKDIRDLRGLLWSSIDNDTSRDLDQVEYAESLPDGTVRLLVGIADVDSTVTKGSAIDTQAAAEATSVYTGVVTFPMLPPVLSTETTSLLDGQQRLSVVIELIIADSGEVCHHDAYPALV